MPGPKTDNTDDNDKFTIINEEGNSEEEETQTPPPEDPPLQTSIENTPPHDIFEPPSREVSMVTPVKQPKTVDNFKSLISGLFFCCRPHKLPQNIAEDNSETKKKGLRYENS